MGRRESRGGGAWKDRGMEGEEGLCFSGIGGEWFLKNDMFSGSQRAACPFVVEGVGKRDVDSVDGGIMEEI